MKEHVIINLDRTVNVPESMKKIGIQYDHNVKTITFDCPRYPDENPSIDMSTMKIFINWMLPDKTLGSTIATNVCVDSENENLMHFDWVITKAVTSVSGVLSALICIKETTETGEETYHWNSELIQSFKVGNGMECTEEIVEQNIDVITQLLVQMDAVNTRTSEEALERHVENYLTENPPTFSDQQADESVRKYMEENAQTHVDDYLGRNPLTLDETLKDSSKAAPADVVGELKGDLVRLNSAFEIPFVLKNKYYINSSGEESGGPYYKCSNYIDTKNSNHVKIKTALIGSASIAVYKDDESKTFSRIISDKYDNLLGWYDIELEDDERYVRFTFYKNGGNESEICVIAFTNINDILNDSEYVKRVVEKCESQLVNVDKELFYDVAELLESENIHGLYVDGVYYENSSTNTFKANVTGLSKVRVVGKSSLNYDICNFLDSSGSVIEKNQATVEKEYDQDFNVPYGAKYVVSSNNNSYGGIALYKYAKHSEIKKLKDNLLHGRVGAYVINENVYIRSNMGNKDIVYKVSLNGSENGAFTFVNCFNVEPSEPISTTNGTLFKDMTDDITPIRFCGSYRGGNHGDSNVTLLTFSNNHNLSVANIGEDWIDTTSRMYTILQIPSAKTLIVANYTGETTPLSGIQPTTSLTKDGVTITFESSANTQLRPAINNIKVGVYDSKGNIISNGDFYGDYFDVVESYDIIHVPSMISYLKANLGNNTNDSISSDEITNCYCTVSNVYRFTEQGAITLFADTHWNYDVIVDSCGYIQSSKIGEYFSIPKINSYKLISKQNGEKQFARNMWDNIDSPPDKYYQYTDANGTKGMILGYCTDIGDGKAEARKLSNSAGFYYTSYKMYPYAFNRSVSADESISVICFRIPFDNYSNEAPSLSWYYVGNDIYVVLNIQNTTDKYIMLPDYMIGKQVSVVESDGSIEVKTPFVTANGIRITVSNYGSCTLKLI